MPPSTPQDRDSGPWYREFWAWFIVVPVLVIFAVCTVLITVAYSMKDDVVADDYYKQGKLINHRFDAEKRAAEMNLVAHLALDNVSGEVTVKLEADTAFTGQQVMLLLSHPIEADEDVVVPLDYVTYREGQSLYRGDLSEPVEGRRYLRLSYYVGEGEATDEHWRLSGEMNTADNRRVTLVP